jgi:hypothetical protein
MSNNRQQTLWELHKENSLFLNKLLVGIPATSIPLLFTAINDAKDRLSHWILLVTLIIVGFTLFLLIHSFFVSEKAIEAVDQNKYKKANILNKRTKRYNFVSMIMLCVSFCLIVILFVMQGYRKEIDNMTAKDGKRTFNTDGLSLPPSFVKNPTPPSKVNVTNGITIPTSILNPKPTPNPSPPTESSSNQSSQK